MFRPHFCVSKSVRFPQIILLFLSVLKIRRGVLNSTQHWIKMIWLFVFAFRYSDKEEILTTICLQHSLNDNWLHFGTILCTSYLLEYPPNSYDLIGANVDIDVLLKQSVASEKVNEINEWITFRGGWKLKRKTKTVQRESEREKRSNKIQFQLIGKTINKK